MGKGGHPVLEQLDGFAQGSSQDVASWEDTRARVGELRPEDGMRSIGIMAHKCPGMDGANQERSVDTSRSVHSVKVAPSWRGP
jgi:hypothetical protein